MNTQQASELKQLLQKVASHPDLFLGKPDIFLAEVFLSGFSAALAKTAGLDLTEHQRVIADRGWRVPSASESVTNQMLESGMSPEQVIAELVAIEIEVVNRSTE